MISPFIETQPELLWAREIRAFSYLQLGQVDKAEEDYRSIYDKYRRPWSGYQIAFVAAALWLGTTRCSRMGGVSFS